MKFRLISHHCVKNANVGVVCTGTPKCHDGRPALHLNLLSRGATQIWIGWRCATGGSKPIEG